MLKGRQVLLLRLVRHTLLALLNVMLIRLICPHNILMNIWCLFVCLLVINCAAEPKCEREQHQFKGATQMSAHLISGMTEVSFKFHDLEKMGETISLYHMKSLYLAFGIGNLY